MSAPHQAPRVRARLGAPPISINPSRAYLRHRAALARAERAQRRARWRNRTLLLCAAVALYLAIGREVVHLAKAQAGLAAAVVRRDARALAKDVERLTQAGRGLSDPAALSPASFTSAGRLAEAEDPSDLDAWLPDDPAPRAARRP